jgi:hypothetical protein
LRAGRSSRNPAWLNAASKLAAVVVLVPDEVAGAESAVRHAELDCPAATLPGLPFNAARRIARFDAATSASTDDPERPSATYEAANPAAIVAKPASPP